MKMSSFSLCSQILHISRITHCNLVRCLSTTVSLNGKRNFRKFLANNKRGSVEYRRTRKNEDEYVDIGVRKVGFEKNGRVVIVREMIPELVVPDLTGFKLKPYVSYRVPDVVQSDFTAKDLFDACYADKIVEDFKKGKLDENGDPLESSYEESLKQDEAFLKARQTGSDIFYAKLPS